MYIYALVITNESCGIFLLLMCCILRTSHEPGLDYVMPLRNQGKSPVLLLLSDLVFFFFSPGVIETLAQTWVSVSESGYLNLNHCTR